MRILHVVEVDQGGVVTYVRELARLQSMAGDEVHVLAPTAAGAFAGAVHTWAPRRRSLPSLIVARRRLAAIVGSVEPDIVHLHSFFPGLLGRARRLGAPVVYQPHSWAFAAVPLVGRPLVTLLERAGLRATDVVVVNCRSEGEEGRRRGLMVEPHVIGLPVDVDRFAPRDLPTPDALAGVGDAAVVVCVGRISAQKGQVELARAWEVGPVEGAVLVLIGPGGQDGLRTAAPTAFGNTLLCVGAQDDVRPFLSRASVSVLPSLYEGQSVAMAESLACGVPVVITDVNGAREAVTPPEGDAAGAVVPVGDMVAVLAEVARRLNDPGLRARESARARAIAVALFEPAGVLARVQGAYADAVGRTVTRA